MDALPGTTLISEFSNESAASVPLVTVGVIVRNEAATIAETLQTLLEQDYPAFAFEIVVVDGGSNDGTYELAKDFEKIAPGRLRVIREREPTSYGKARSLVLSYGQPGVRYFAFTDGDCSVPSNWLRVLVDTLESEEANVAGCGGPRCAHPKETGLALALGYYLADPLATGMNPGFAARKVRFTRGPGNYNAAYRAEIFKRFRYDPVIRIGEDLDLNYRIRRAGLQFVQVSTAVAHHGSRSFKELRTQMSGYGHAKAAFLMRNRRIDHFTSVVPPVLVLGITLLPLVASIYPKVSWAVLAFYVAYACLVFCITCSVTWRMRSFWGLACLPAAILTHLSYGIGFLAETTVRLFRSAAASFLGRAQKKQY